MTALIEWARFLAGAAFLLVGIAIFVVEMIGVFRFRYVLNRMHAAAMGDTLGLGSCLLGLIVMSGWNNTSLKLFLVILFLWFSSPVSSHLIARLEVATEEEKEKHYRRKSLDEAAGSKAVETGRAGAEEAAEPETRAAGQAASTEAAAGSKAVETGRAGAEEAAEPETRAAGQAASTEAAAGSKAAETGRAGPGGREIFPQEQEAER